VVIAVQTSEIVKYAFEQFKGILLERATINI